MDDLIVRQPSYPIAQRVTPHDVMAIFVRRKRMVAISFICIVLGALLAAVLLPKGYESQMKILVKHERQDPLLSTQNSSGPEIRSGVTEEEINTEVELIKSHDLLEQVVMSCGLNKRTSALKSLLHYNVSEEAKLARAVRNLEGALSVEPIKKANLIVVSYSSPDRYLAQRVVTTVSELYMQKHLAVHRSPGAAEFFAQQAERYQEEIADSQARLQMFSSTAHTVSALAERDNALLRGNELDSTLAQTRSAIQETQRKIAVLEDQLAHTPARIETSDRNQNALLVGQLRSQLATLELKRVELLAKYEPTTRQVHDIEAQIAQLQDTVDKEEKAPVREITTDNNPTTLVMSRDLATERASIASLKAREVSLQKSSAQYRAAAFDFNNKDFEQQDLLRDLKSKEQEYLLYVNKREEARISDALDNKRIVNVAVAEPPTLPFLPLHSPFMVFLIGVAFACVASVGSAYMAEYIDGTFRPATEIEAYLSIPILAKLPAGPELQDYRASM